LTGSIGDSTTSKSYTGDGDAIVNALPLKNKLHHPQQSSNPSNNYPFSSEQQQQLSSLEQQQTTYRYLPMPTTTIDDKCIDANTSTNKLGKLLSCNRVDDSDLFWWNTPCSLIIKSSFF
jgi:hypothetical protein